MQQDAPTRNKTASVALTAEEKEALALVCLHRRVTESQLLRERARVDEIVAEADRIRRALAEIPLAQSA